MQDKIYTTNLHHFLLHMDGLMDVAAQQKSKKQFEEGSYTQTSSHLDTAPITFSS